jgi:hypothetical protein
VSIARNMVTRNLATSRAVRAPSANCPSQAARCHCSTAQDGRPRAAPFPGRRPQSAALPIDQHFGCKLVSTNILINSCTYGCSQYTDQQLPNARVLLGGLGRTTEAEADDDCLASGTTVADGDCIVSNTVAGRAGARQQPRSEYGGAVAVCLDSQ